MKLKAPGLSSAGAEVQNGRSTDLCNKKTANPRHPLRSPQTFFLGLEELTRPQVTGFWNPSIGPDRYFGW